MSDDLQRDHAVQWRAAINALAEFENVVQAIFFYADVPAGEALRRVLKAGLRRPAEHKALW